MRTSGALTATTEDSIAALRAAQRAARAKPSSLKECDFSFLTDLDEESGSASLLFDVGASGVPLALSKIQLILQARF